MVHVLLRQSIYNSIYSFPSRECLLCVRPRVCLFGRHRVRTLLNNSIRHVAMCVRTFRVYVVRMASTMWTLLCIDSSSSFMMCECACVYVCVLRCHEVTAQRPMRCSYRQYWIYRIVIVQVHMIRYMDTNKCTDTRYLNNPICLNRLNHTYP